MRGKTSYMICVDWTLGIQGVGRRHDVARYGHAIEFCVLTSCCVRLLYIDEADAALYTETSLSYSGDAGEKASVTGQAG